MSLIFSSPRLLQVEFASVSSSENNIMNSHKLNILTFGSLFLILTAAWYCVAGILIRMKNNQDSSWRWTCFSYDETYGSKDKEKLIFQTLPSVVPSGPQNNLLMHFIFTYTLKQKERKCTTIIETPENRSIDKMRFRASLKSWNPIFFPSSAFTNGENQGHIFSISVSLT